MSKPFFAYRYGITRNVLLVGPYAIKIPVFCNWENFLCGLLGNMQEVTFSGMPRVCPIVFHIPFGFLAVMKRAKEMTYNESLDNWEEMERIVELGIPVELKHSSFGWLNGILVAIDYGS